MCSSSIGGAYDGVDAKHPKRFGVSTYLALDKADLQPSTRVTMMFGPGCFAMGNGWLANSVGGPTFPSDNVVQFFYHMESRHLKVASPGGAIYMR
jgi:hypothetical protein